MKTGTKRVERAEKAGEGKGNKTEKKKGVWEKQHVSATGCQ